MAGLTREEKTTALVLMGWKADERFQAVYYEMTPEQREQLYDIVSHRKTAMAMEKIRGLENALNSDELKLLENDPAAHEAKRQEIINREYDNQIKRMKNEDPENLLLVESKNKKNFEEYAETQAPHALTATLKNLMDDAMDPVINKEAKAFAPFHNRGNPHHLSDDVKRLQAEIIQGYIQKNPQKLQFHLDEATCEFMPLPEQNPEVISSQLAITDDVRKAISSLLQYITPAPKGGAALSIEVQKKAESGTGVAPRPSP